jgi:4-alpha-glucanotransferase
MNPLERRRLARLAEAYGVQTAYVDALGQRRRAAPEALLAVLRELGAPVARVADADAALEARLRARWQRVVEPVCVAWAGRPATLAVQAPEGAPERVRIELRTEAGEETAYDAPLTGRALAEGEAGGRRYRRVAVPLPAGLAPGVHRLAATLGARRDEALLVCAPYKLFGSAAGPRRWAVFAPLYALHSAAHPGGGTFTELGALLRWVRAQGGMAVQTLPLLAAFLRTPLDVSPYSPVSRLFWNELYVDTGGDRSSQHADRGFAGEPVTGDGLVDYRALAAARRRELEAQAARFFADTTGGERLEAFRAFVAGRPLVEDYARFQATVERQGAGWPAWPAALQGAAPTAADYDADAYRYHLYAQWQASEQLGAAAGQARAQGDGLFLDVPLGVHGGGFDTWRYKALFAHGASAGAPPDPFFTQGQTWGFPPLIPEALREDGYAYVRAYLQHHLDYAAVLRLDHVMALHRLFWIPAGFTAREGLYVHSPAEEWYALLSLASHRNRAVVVGENLGTVPAAVNEALAAHALRRMYVLQYEVHPEREPAVGAVAADAVASLNTHDMPPFAAYWNEADVADRQALGLLDAAGAQAVCSAREAARDALRAWAGLPSSAPLSEVVPHVLMRLAASPARLLIVNLEDLWLAEATQNTPGTHLERPNWRRLFRPALEDIFASVGTTLSAVDRLRNEGERT